MTAVLAEFVDCRPVKSRSVLQLVLEVPIEQADKAVISLGGFPLPGESRWVGVALAPKERKDKLAEYPANELIQTDEFLNPLDTEDNREKKRRQFDSLQPSAQAAILCADPEFVQFLSARDIAEGARAIFQGEKGFVFDPATAIRNECGVKSRSEFNTDPKAKNRWDVLRSQFKQWQTDKRYSESIRA